MKLYILRHGHAPSAAQASVASDAERPLSPEGRKAAAETAERLARLGGKPSLILHSPLKRAVQTAQETARVLSPEKGVQVFPPLANVLPASELLAALRKDPAASVPELLVVGHQPQLGELAALLCGQIFELKTAGLIAVELSAAPRLLWHANPGDPDPAP